MNEEEEILRKRRQFAENEFKIQQEVMEYLIKAVHSHKFKSKLTTYSLYKSSSFFGYGIAFHTENIQPTLPTHKLVFPLIEIEPNSPADDVGMKNGQRVVAVNNKLINYDFATLEDVVQSIEDSYYNRDFTDITVLDPLIWNDFMDNPREAAHFINNSEERQLPSIENGQYTEKVKVLPRLCRLSRQNIEEQYGFDFKTLKLEGKHIAINIRKDYLADRAGLCDGDYILEVNGIAIDGLKHDVVVSMISSNPKQVDLLVLTNKINEQQINKEDVVFRQKTPSSSASNIHELNTQTENNKIIIDNILPRFCRLERIEKSNPYGFDFKTLKNIKRHVITNIRKDSIADKVGILQGDYILEVNGEFVDGLEHSDVVRNISSNPNQVDLLVVNDIQGYFDKINNSNNKDDKNDSLNLNGEILNDSNKAKLENKIPRICSLIGKNNPLGFTIRLDQNNQNMYRINEITPNSPADKSGLLHDDIIIEISEINIQNMKYNQVINLIKNKIQEDDLDFLVVDSLTYEWYQSNDIKITKKLIPLEDVRF